MSTDRELLELAMKAYADPNIIKGIYPDFTRWIGRNEDLGCDVFVNWNPLTDDGDALRLAVKLNLIVASSSEFSESSSTLSDEKFNFPSLAQELWANNIDKFSATRRAIVRAAAAIGEKLNEELNKS